DIITELKTIDGIDYTITYLQFVNPQTDGTEIRADVSGIDVRGAFGSLPPITGELQNPVDAIINLAYYFTLNVPRASVFNAATFEAVRAVCEARGYKCAGAVVEAVSPRQLLSDLCKCFLIDFYQNKDGEMALAIDYTADDGVPAHPIFNTDLIAESSLEWS